MWIKSGCDFYPKKYQFKNIKWLGTFTIYTIETNRFTQRTKYNEMISWTFLTETYYNRIFNIPDK